MSSDGDIAVNDLAKAFEAYVMNNRDGDAHDLAMFVDSLVTTRIAEVLQRSRLETVALCPHGYKLANLADGTDTCSGCSTANRRVNQ